MEGIFLHDDNGDRCGNDDYDTENEDEWEGEEYDLCVCLYLCLG